MNASVKFILIFVLLILSFSIGGSALNSTEELSSTSQVSASSSDTGVYALLDGDIAYHNKLQALSVSDIELGTKLMSETYSFFNQRLRRAVEVSDFLKDIIRKLCIRENLLVLDRSKSYHSDKDSCYARFSCEYYIFALRRILI